MKILEQKVVRNLGSERTHVAGIDREKTTQAVWLGSTYTQPYPDTRALCGVRITDGVVMLPGTKVKCPACRYLRGEEA